MKRGYNPIPMKRIHLKMRNVVFFLILVCMGCERHESTDYIVSQQDSLFAERQKKEPRIVRLKTPESLKWYSNTVVVLDRDRVFLYQTEIERETSGCGDSGFPANKYPNYLFLTPENLISVDTAYFFDFVKHNDHIFNLSDLPEDHFSFFQIATTNDTIKQAFVDQLLKVFRPSKNRNFQIRMATEEEKTVVAFKRGKKEFVPTAVKWSRHFLSGRNAPNEPAYYREERQAHDVRKAVPFGRASMARRHFCM